MAKIRMEYRIITEHNGDIRVSGRPGVVRHNIIARELLFHHGIDKHPLINEAKRGCDRAIYDELYGDLHHKAAILLHSLRMNMYPISSTCYGSHKQEMGRLGKVCYLIDELDKLLKLEDSDE